MPGRANSDIQAKKQYVILISVDGFRYDYAAKYNARNLQRFAAEGVTSEGMRPGYPSLTFPNHYSIVTGLYPGHHGLVDNNFYDRKKKRFYYKADTSAVRDSSWYSGKPLWVLAEEQQMLTATFYWVGSEAAIMGTRPTYNYRYNRAIATDARIGIVKNWLSLPEKQRPHLLCLYFSEVDNAGHLYGAESAELGAAVKNIDAVISTLVTAVDETGLKVNYIFLSDHGMVDVNDKSPIPLPQEIDRTNFLVPPGDALVHLYALDKSRIGPTYKALRQNANGFKVYLHNELPRRWNYGFNDDRFNRVGDIVLVPQPGLVFNLTNAVVDKGKHGFDPADPKMMATFIAWGPAFKQGISIKAFDNVHIYPLIAKILGLTYHHQVDGNVQALQKIMK